MNCIYQPSNKKTEQFIERATIVHGDIYDYSTSEYVNTYTKVKIICPFHGVFLQEPKSHLKGCGCKLCGEVKRQKSSSFSLQDFVSRAKSVHGDQYDYSSVQYHNNKTAVTIICPIRGHFSQLPGTHLRGSGCKRTEFGIVVTMFLFGEPHDLCRSPRVIQVS